MRISDEIKIWIGVLVSVQILTTLGSIELLMRMSPAIERILQENVYSISAVEDMLVSLALTEISAEERGRRFTEALGRARNNITEADEGQVLAEIDVIQRQAMAGDLATRDALVRSLNQLGQINRESMRRADDQARQLSTTGAWAMVLLGFSGFLVSLLTIHRLRRQFLRPLVEIHEVLRAFRAGELFRRCSLQGYSPEFAEVGSAVNRLLEERWSRSTEQQKGLAALDRAALLRLLEMRSEPTVVLDRPGTIGAMNAAARTALEGPEGDRLRQRFMRIARGQEEPGEGLAVAELAGRGWLCVLPRPEGL